MNIKELKPLDYIIIIAVIAVLTIGALVIKGKNKFAKSPVEATQKIAFQFHEVFRNLLSLCIFV